MDSLILKKYCWICKTSLQIFQQVYRYVKKWTYPYQIETALR